MCRPQVIDDGPLILTIFPAPWAVGKAGKVLKGLGIMNSLQAHDLQGLPWQILPSGILVPWVKPGECSWLILGDLAPSTNLAVRKCTHPIGQCIGPAL